MMHIAMHDAAAVREMQSRAELRTRRERLGERHAVHALTVARR